MCRSVTIKLLKFILTNNCGSLHTSRFYSVGKKHPNEMSTLRFLSGWTSVLLLLHEWSEGNRFITSWDWPSHAKKKIKSLDHTSRDSQCELGILLHGHTASVILVRLWLVLVRVSRTNHRRRLKIHPSGVRRLFVNSQFSLLQSFLRTKNVGFLQLGNRKFPCH